MKKIDFSYTEQVKEETEAIAVRIYRQERRSHLKNRSAVEKVSDKIIKRPSTKQEGKRIRKMETFEGSLEPW